ncbi:very long chain fatty acid elongase 5-like [Liolophura sinensis]|uniref:very long chain fatty acid elongase 5-like n=1 Tax=Liolophura sinensis TaxID=3198878 RepID=UPI003158E0E7
MTTTVDNIQYFLKVTVRLQTFPLFCFYLLLVALSPLWQRISSPLNLRPVLIVYNFACSCVSAYTLVGFVYAIYKSGSTFHRESTSAILPFFWAYWMTKNLELLDTVFMVLRHKQRQISFLHVYHHSSILLLSDVAYHHYPWPAIAVFLGLNSFVHVVLYFYYGLTALSPGNPPQWKKNLTQLQIFQFLIGFVQASIGYAYHHFCVYSILYGMTMTCLFSNFYYQAYIRKPKTQVNDKIK